MKKAAVIVILLVLASVPAFSSPYAVLSASYGVSYDTNAFSYPLPSWEEGEMNFSYERRVSHHAALSGDVFFGDGPAGISASFVMGFPLMAERAEYDGQDYLWKKDEVLPFLSISAGPVFRYRTSAADLCLALRLGVGTYDFFETGFTLDLVADASVRFPAGDRIVISLGGIYEAHLMKFSPESVTQIYEPGYIMLGLGGYVSVGIKVGNDE